MATYKDNEMLGKLKKSVEESYEYFRRNYDRFNDFIRFVFVSTLTSDDISKLKTVGKPPLTFNILEAFVSKERGEFMQQEPSFEVKPAEGLNPLLMTQQFLDTIDILEAHLREIMTDPSNDQMQYNVFTDLLVGGMSVIEVKTDYSSPHSFEQCIYAERVYNPCMCGFDPMAQTSHKGDGRYCFKVYPMTTEAFEEEFGAEALADMKFSQTVEGFTWSYQTQKRDMVLVVDYYVKKPKTTQLYKLSDGQDMLKDDYEDFLEEWVNSGRMEVPPVVVQKRPTQIETICRYRFCETRVLDYIETDYEMLPLVFIDGNSVMVQDSPRGSYEQYTRPMVYNAKGAQKLKDFGGQTMAAEIENMVMHKFIAPIEGMPDDSNYQDAYTNPQIASNILYKSFRDDDPSIGIQPPREVQRTQTPQVVLDAFHGTDSLIQMILGSYDLQPAVQGDVSGKAIQQGQLQSSLASRPYLMGYIKGMNRVAEIIVNLIPKYYVTPRTIPIRKPDGKKDYVVINNVNDPNSIMMKYDPHSLQVVVEEGPSATVQKQVAMQQLTQIAQTLPSFAQFLDQEGGEILIDNMDVQGGDRLKIMYGQWMQKMQGSQQQQQQFAQAMQQAELQERSTKAAEAQARVILDRKKQEHEEAKFVAEYLQTDEKNQQDFKVKVANLAIDNKKADAEVMMDMQKLQQSQVDQLLSAEQIDAEKARTQVDLATSLSSNALEWEKHRHEVEMSKKEPGGDEA